MFGESAVEAISRGADVVCAVGTKQDVKPSIHRQCVDRLEAGQTYLILRRFAKRSLEGRTPLSRRTPRNLVAPPRFG